MPLHYSCNINRVNFILMKNRHEAHGLEARFGVYVQTECYGIRACQHLTGFGSDILFSVSVVHIIYSFSLLYLYAYRWAEFFFPLATSMCFLLDNISLVRKLVHFVIQHLPSFPLSNMKEEKTTNFYRAHQIYQDNQCQQWVSLLICIHQQCWFRIIYLMLVLNLSPHKHTNKIIRTSVHYLFIH